MDVMDMGMIEEDRKVFIDLDDGGEEDIVVNWHLEIRRFFDENTAVVVESNLVSIMKQYINSITSRAIHFEDIDTLKVMVEKHIEHIYWLYKDLVLCFSDTYLDNMEPIMTFYLNLTLRSLLALKRKMKVTQMQVTRTTENVIKRMSRYLLQSEYHIFHVLIKQTINSSDNEVKDVLNILQSNICKQLLKNLFMHYLFSNPIRDKSDEAYCRVYILFENWKAFEGNKQDAQMDELMSDLMGRSSECIENNEFLTLILKPQVSDVCELMSTVGCNPAITKSYFDYVNSRQKQELEILNDIEKLALEDCGFQEDDDDDDEEYTDLFGKMLGDASKDAVVENTNNNNMKDETQFKSSSIEQESEVICCDSDSDSDIEIVDIKPSKSFGRGVNLSQKIYIETLKDSCAIKPPKKSFLDSISIDTDKKYFKSSSRRNSCTSDKSLVPNPQSYEPADKPPEPKRDDISSGLANKENEINGTSTNSEAMEHIENSDSTPSETIRGLNELENSSNIRAESATGQYCTLVVDNSVIEMSETDVSSLKSNSKEGGFILDEHFGTALCEVDNRQPQSEHDDIPCGFSNKQNVAELEEVDVRNSCELDDQQLHPERADDNCEFLTKESEGHVSHSEVEQEENSNIIQSNRLPLNTINVGQDLQKETSQKEYSLIDDQIDIITEIPTLTETNNDNQISMNIDVCHSPKLCEANSDSSQHGLENVSSKLQALQIEKQVLNEISDSVNQDISKTTCDVNSNDFTSSPMPASSLYKENTNLVENLTLPIHHSSTEEYSTNRMIKDLNLVTSEKLDISKEKLDNLNNSIHRDTEFVDSEVSNQTYIEDINLQCNSPVDNLLSKQIRAASKEQLHLQSCPPEKLINDTVKVSSVCKTNNKPDGKTVLLNSDTQCVNSNKLPENSLRCNGSYMSKDLFKKNITLRKRRHSDSNVYECLGPTRWGADLVRDKSEFRVVQVETSTSPESVPPPQLEVNDPSSMFLDTGQCVAPQPFDTGQNEVIAELSPPMTDPGEEHVADQVNRSDPKTAQHIRSDKRTKSSKDELCGYPTPPGSEEDIDDTRPDPVYSNIFPTPVCSTTGDCYSGGRAVYRLNSDTEREVTVGGSSVTGQDASHIRPSDNQKDSSTESVVPDIVYNDQSMTENDFLTVEIDPRDSLVSLEEEELLERLSDEERNEDNNRDSTNLAKSFSQIRREAISDYNPEESSKLTSIVHESDLNRKETKAAYSLNKEQMLQKDSYISSTSSNKKRKRTSKGVRFPDSPKEREKSYIVRQRKARKVDTAKSFDEFEAEVWNQQRPIGKCAYNVDESISQHSYSPSSSPQRIEMPTAEKPSSSPITNHISSSRSPMDLPPLSCSTPKQPPPPLKGILKKDDRSHSYYPLHPVDNDRTSSFVYIHVEPDPDVGRGKMGTHSSLVKVSRNSLNACKVSRDYKRLFQRYLRVSVDHVWRNNNLEWEKISDPSKQLLWENMPQPLCRMDYDKSTKDSLKCQILFIEQLDNNQTTSAENTRNPNLEIVQGPGTVNLSNEIVSIKSTEDDLSHDVRLHVPSMSPCLSPTSNTSSEFSDPTNLIPYQDIERALQVVEPDDQACCNGPTERIDPLRRDSGGDTLDNMSVEAIKLLSNNADFHKIFCDFEGEIFIQNVPVLDTEETDRILNVDGTYIKPPPKFDVRLSDKLTDDLILNLNSDEELLKKICQELETNSLVDSLSNSANNAAEENSSEILHKSDDAYRLSPTASEKLSSSTPDDQTGANIFSVESAAEKEESWANLYSQNSVHSSSKASHSSPLSYLPYTSEGHERMSENCFPVDYQSVDRTSILQGNGCFEAIADSVGTVGNIRVNLPSNCQLTTQVSHCALASNYYLQSDQNIQSFQNNQMYQSPTVSAQVFQNSRIGQARNSSTPNGSYCHSSQKPSLVVNVPMPTESLLEYSRKKSANKSNFPTNQNAVVTNLQTFEPHKLDVVSAQNVPLLRDDFSSSTNNNIYNASSFSPEIKPKAAKRGRPPKKSKKTKEKPQVRSNRVKRPAISDRYQERVPSIYHQDVLPVQTFTEPAKNPHQETVVANSKCSSSVSNIHGKEKLLPMPVPQTFNFETDTLKQEVYNIRLESGKVDNENDAEFETHLPLKKRKLSIPVPITASSTPSSILTTSTHPSFESVETNEISYPATPMLSIADFYNPTTSRPFKTPAEKKQLPVDPSLVPIRYDLPNDTTPFTCTMDTFTSNVYRLNECLYNVKLDRSSYCPPPPVVFPPESFGRSN